MAERTIKKENFVKIGGKQWFDKSTATSIASYQAGSKPEQKAELYRLPSGIFIAHVWNYYSGDDSGYYSDDWKVVTVEDPLFQMFLDHMDPIPAHWITHRQEIK